MEKVLLMIVVNIVEMTSAKIVLMIALIVERIVQITVARIVLKIRIIVEMIVLMMVAMIKPGYNFSPSDSHCLLSKTYCNKRLDLNCFVEDHFSLSPFSKPYCKLKILLATRLPGYITISLSGKDC